MLPNILDVAQEYGVQFNPKTFGKRESLAKCPFCKEDSASNKKKKFYLSLNTDFQLYKCWYCSKSGGVLDFETKLSGKAFNEVKQKYFGEQQRPVHSAYKLDPYQLETIGWREYKRKSFKDFQAKRDEVLKDWSCYLRNELKRNFALFLCIAHLENQPERQEELLIWFIRKCWESRVPNMYEMILDQFLIPEFARSEWAQEGVEIGRIAWKACIKTMDFDVEDLLVYVVFADYFFRENKKAHSNKERANKVI